MWKKGLIVIKLIWHMKTVESRRKKLSCWRMSGESAFSFCQSLTSLFFSRFSESWPQHPFTRRVNDKTHGKDSLDENVDVESLNVKYRLNKRNEKMKYRNEQTWQQRQVVVVGPVFFFSLPLEFSSFLDGFLQVCWGLCVFLAWETKTREKTKVKRFFKNYRISGITQRHSWTASSSRPSFLRVRLRQIVFTTE